MPARWWAELGVSSVGMAMSVGVRRGSYALRVTLDSLLLRGGSMFPLCWLSA